MNEIEVQGLTKTFRVFDRAEGVWGAFKNLFHREYRWVDGVSNLSFTIARGEMVGLIGPNGAGKSTTIKMLTGILSPSSGSIRVAGYNPFADRLNYVKNIGVVFGQRSQLWWDLAVIESFKLLKRIYGVSDSDYAERMQTFKRVLAIEPLLVKPVRKLSLGERMRCDIGAALIHNPQVVFLDEPTIGLDLIAKDEIRRFLKEINSRYGTTVILTTHDLTDIEELCERVLIIDKGKLVFEDSLSNLKGEVGGDQIVRVKLAHPVEDLQIKHRDGVKFKLDDSQSIEARFNPSTISSGQVLKNLIDEFDVREVQIEEPSIEEVIRRIYLKS